MTERTTLDLLWSTKAAGLPLFETTVPFDELCAAEPQVQHNRDLLLQLDANVTIELVFREAGRVPDINGSLPRFAWFRVVDGASTEPEEGWYPVFTGDVEDERQACVRAARPSVANIESEPRAAIGNRAGC